MLFTISLFAGILYMQSGYGFEFQKTTETSGVLMMKTLDTYITYDRWRMVYYIDLNDYHHETRELEKCVKRIEMLCNKVPDDEHCEQLIKRFKKHLDIIKQDMEYIYSFRIDTPRRLKRSLLGLNFVGSYYFKPLYGLMDEEDALQIYEKINEVINQQERHRVFIKDQLSIIKEGTRVTNATFSNFRHNMETFREEVEKLLNDQNKILVEQMTKQYLTSIATLMLMEHDHFMKKLKHATSKAFNGDFTELVTLNRFSQDLSFVNVNLGGEHTILSRNFDDIRAVSSIRHYITEDKIWIEITVPIIKKSPYKLTKVIALPMTVGNNTILFDFHDTQFLVHEQQAEYIPISDVEVEKCQRTYNGNLICLPRKDTFLRNEEVCESGILFGSNVNNILRKCPFRYVRMSNFVRKLEEGSYYVYSVEPIELIESCANGTMREDKISGRGILKLTPECTLQVGKMKITIRNVFLSNETLKIDIPFQFRNITEKIIQDLSLHKTMLKIPSLRFINHEKEFRTIARSVDYQQKEIEKETTIEKFTNTPIFSLLGKLLTPLIILLVLIIVILKISKKSCCC